MYLRFNANLKQEISINWPRFYKQIIQISPPSIKKNLMTNIEEEIEEGKKKG